MTPSNGGPTQTGDASADETRQPSQEDLDRLTQNEIERWGNKSKAIRGLSSEGMSTSEIATRLQIRYQHARNVQGQILKREVKAQRELERARKALNDKEK